MQDGIITAAFSALRLSPLGFYHASLSYVHKELGLRGFRSRFVNRSFSLAGCEMASNAIAKDVMQLHS